MKQIIWLQTLRYLLPDPFTRKSFLTPGLDHNAKHLCLLLSKRKTEILREDGRI